jgi:hypothetical protein
VHQLATSTTGRRLTHPFTKALLVLYHPWSRRPRPAGRHRHGRRFPLAVTAPSRPTADLLSARTKQIAKRLAQVGVERVSSPEMLQGAQCGRSLASPYGTLPHSKRADYGRAVADPRRCHAGRDRLNRHGVAWPWSTPPPRVALRHRRVWRDSGTLQAGVRTGRAGG